MKQTKIVLKAIFWTLWALFTLFAAIIWYCAL